MSDGPDLAAAPELNHDSEAIGLADFGSTFTKLRVVTPDGQMVGSTQYPTVHGDALVGLTAARHQLEDRHPTLSLAETLACSSAGGGLRMAVVGLERELTVEAARQAALSAGARVTTVVSAGLKGATEAIELLAGQPDIILLVGGTNGGDGVTLRGSAKALAEVTGHHVPVVIAGNETVQDEAAAWLREAGWTVAQAPNVMPAVRAFSPSGVREVLRGLFISHVIGGKLGGGEQLKRLVQMATPDAVLRGTELLAGLLAQRGIGAGLIVVDVGGATTDVHSALPGSRQPRGYKRALLPQSTSARSVEADLGVRWNALGIVEAAREEGLLDATEIAQLGDHAAAREQEPTYLSDCQSEADVDRRLTMLAITVALRRHVGRERLTLTPDGAVLAREGRDLTEASILIGTGGPLQSLNPADLDACLASALGHGRLLLPRHVRTRIDHDYVLAAAGLLAGTHETAAGALLESCMSSLVHPPVPTRKEP
ncbi:glutamate mutase L [Mycolicibacterium fluoranthenivorans]|uniref:Glutamate mutase L n=1 Tax=Mycolicibacterium fluoranthenivorans TaxID=258505 RepID=A0A1G4WX01_9MYCO|nr:glutamate mutase L [Mycolicibacterium fluoranthenivorans]QNJ94815.1 glutamate mutase L [Mycolicibacterium fluoranthenivorans]SCX31416.1 conserved hypothetical protein [Mycolicibacterium fluoranthenivorans]